METCHLIVQNVSSRRDICSLSRVCRSFRVAAERVLYNTLYLSGSRNTMKLCETLAKQSCVSVYVEALTISRTDEEDKRGGEVALSTDYWNAIADVLCATTRLRHLTIHLEDVAGFEHAWILDECKFKLRTFHCDLDWDSSLARFLEMQTELVDLYLLDFPHPDSCPSLDASSDSSTLSSQLDISPDSLPALSVVECPTTDAVETLVPRRPITRIKTSLSSSTPEGKREEMDRLFTSLRLSTKNILSIDLADPSYSSELSLLLLRCCTADCRTRAELRHLAALILPVDGPEVQTFPTNVAHHTQHSCCSPPAPTALWPADAILTIAVHRS